MASIDEPHYLLMLQLVQSQLLLLFFQNQLLSLELILQIFSLPLQSTYLLISFLLYFGSLTFELFDLFLELRNDLLIYFFSIRLLLLQLVLDLFHFFLLDDIGFMQFSNLLLFFVDCLYLLLGLLRQLLQLFLHTADLIGSLLVLIVFECLLLCLANFLQRFLLFL